MCQINLKYDLGLVQSPTISYRNKIRIRDQNYPDDVNDCDDKYRVALENMSSVSHTYVYIYVSELPYYDVIIILMVHLIPIQLHCLPVVG